MEPECRYTVASEPELDKLLAGREAGIGILWSRSFRPVQLGAGSTGVVWRRGGRPDDPVRPLALVSRGEDIRRLCGRYAQLRSDLSPLTTWCHLLTPDFFERLDSPVRDADLAGLEAAWIGLVIAEATLLAERPLASVRMPSCLATQSFAIARTRALWSHVSDDDIVKRFDSANRICRSEDASQRGELRATRFRSSLEPIWSSLAGLTIQAVSSVRRELQPMVASLRGLESARSEKAKQEAGRFVTPLLDLVPEAKAFEGLTNLTPESRLRLFDNLVSELNRASADRESVRMNALALLAGYLATVAAGGAPSLALAEANAQRWPQITAWAYVVGGIGERIVWTSGFDGLGRLVARELLRPLRFDEPPMCDFAFDEAAVLADSKLADPLVHLKVKQARIASVALLPGVNISIPVADLAAQEAGKAESLRAGHKEEPFANPLGALAEALFPYIRDRIEQYLDTSREADGSQSTRSRRRPKSQAQLPLNNPRK